MLVNDHSGANQRLSKIAESKQWPLPAPPPRSAPPTGTASSDFDAKWTAEMIAGHERSKKLYHAEAQTGEDKDLRQYASETLPTIVNEPAIINFPSGWTAIARTGPFGAVNTVSTVPSTLRRATLSCWTPPTIEKAPPINTFLSG